MVGLKYGLLPIILAMLGLGQK